MMFTHWARTFYGMFARCSGCSKDCMNLDVRKCSHGRKSEHFADVQTMFRMFRMFAEERGVCDQTKY